MLRFLSLAFRAGPLLALLVTGCKFTADVGLARHAQKQEHYEIIRTLQPRLDRKEAVPSSQLLFLAGAYAETRNYARLFPVCDLWEAQISQGDRYLYGGELSAMPHTMRANAFLDLGDPVHALGEAQVAVAILQGQTPATNGMLASLRIDALGVLGLSQALLHHPVEAEAALRRLEGVEIQGPIGPQKYAALARIWMALGRYDLALAASDDPQAEYHSAVSMLIDKTYQVIPLAYLRAKCQFELGRTAEARNGYDQLLAHPHLPELGGIHWLVLLDRARIAQGEGQDPLAETLLRKAVTVIEAQRASIGTEAGRIGYVGDKQTCYQELVALLVRRGRAEEAFGFVERAKGRALVDLLASQKTLAPSRASSRTEALARLEAADQQLTVLPDPAGGQGGGTRGILLAARKDLLTQAPDLASLVMVPELPTSGLQAKLAGNETLLEYYAAGPRWMAFVVTRGAVTATLLDAQDLASKVWVLRQALSDPRDATVAAKAASLYQELLAPVVAQLRTPRLIVVPHGVLHYLPFCALGPAQSPGASPDLMLDRFSLRMLPSATVLTFLKPSKRGGAALILGNPDVGNPALDLPFAQEEARALAELLPDSTLLLRKEATAERLAQPGLFEVIHVAAHGFFDEARPLDSALFLAATARTPGTLKVSDLYTLELNTDLVTLSACETALSKVSSGDDVVGFTRGLLYSGCRSVLSSLWKVDDEATRDVMIDFYTALRNLPDKAQALRHAQRAVRERHPHPYYWAAFTMTGNSD